MLESIHDGDVAVRGGEGNHAKSSRAEPIGQLAALWGHLGRPNWQLMKENLMN